MRYRTWVCAAALLIGAGVFRPGLAAAQSADSLTLPAALTLARADNPSLAAARLRADAAAERIGPAGALPDPQLTLGLMNRPLHGFGAGERMTMNTVGLSQRIPWPGQLAAERDWARRSATAERWDAAEVEAQLVRQVAMRYYEVAALDQSLDILRETQGLLEQFVAVSRARYSVGQGLQQDVLQAAVAVARMTEEITTTEATRVGMAARLNALLGRDATTAVPRLTVPEMTDSVPPPGELWDRAVAARPALAAADARVEAAAAGERAAQADLWPDLMIGVTWGQRPQFDDMVSLSVGLSLPLWAGSRQLPRRREAAALRAGAEAGALDLRNETFAQLIELRAEADRAIRLGHLYRTTVLPQARAAVSSSLAAYRVGRVDVMTLLENQLTVNRYQLELVRLTARYHQAAAGIDALLGTLGGAR